MRLYKLLTELFELDKEIGVLLKKRATEETLLDYANVIKTNDLMRSLIRKQQHLIKIIAIGSALQ